MMDDTEVNTGQSDDSSSANETAVIDQLKAELSEYKSRLGDLAQKSGTERQQLEEKYNRMVSETSSYYTEELKKHKKIIEDLEQELLQSGGDDAARVVIESRNARDKAEEEARERQERAKREEEENLARLQRELDSAVRSAMNVYGCPFDVLQSVHTPEEAWATAAKWDREQTEKKFMPPPPEEVRQREVDEAESRERVPAATSSAPRTEREQRQQRSTIQQQIDQLEERRAAAISRRRLSEAMGLLREIEALKTEL